MSHSMSNLHCGRIAVFITCIVISIVASACQPSAEDENARRLILIGIDGASPRIVEELMAEGRLPNLTKIANGGIYGRLRSEMPIYSPRIWNTIATGKTAEKHGIVSFAYKDEDGRQHLFTSADRHARALWTIASRAGFRVGVVNFWNTYPLEKIDGVMVSDHILAKEIAGRRRLTGAPEDDLGAVVYPEAWNERLSDMVNDRATPLPDYPSPFAEGRALPRWVERADLQRRFEEDGSLARMAQEISNVEKPDVMMVLLTGIDRISHHIWGVMEPAESYPEGLVPTAEAREGGRRALLEYYEYTDALIGVLTEDFGADDLVMVVSDHGFEAGHALMSLTGLHDTKKAIDGVIYARGPGIAPGGEPGKISINDIAPTLLTWLGLPVAEDMDGSIAAFLVTHRVPAITSYDGLAVEFVNAEEVASGVEGDIVDELKALGYLDAD